MKRRTLYRVLKLPAALRWWMLKPVLVVSGFGLGGWSVSSLWAALKVHHWVHGLECLLCATVLLPAALLAGAAWFMFWLVNLDQRFSDQRKARRTPAAATGDWRAQSGLSEYEKRELGSLEQLLVEDDPNLAGRLAGMRGGWSISDIRAGLQATRLVLSRFWRNLGPWIIAAGRAIGAGAVMLWLIFGPREGSRRSRRSSKSNPRYHS